MSSVNESKLFSVRLTKNIRLVCWGIVLISYMYHEIKKVENRWSRIECSFPRYITAFRFLLKGHLFKPPYTHSKPCPSPCQSALFFYRTLIIIDGASCNCLLIVHCTYSLHKTWGFCLCCSFSYTQCLAHGRCSVNICGMSSKAMCLVRRET